MNGVRHAAAWAWKSSTPPFCTLAPGYSDDWEKTQARREVGCCYLFSLWDFYFTTSGKIQPRQVKRGLNEPQKGESKKEGERKIQCTSWWASTSLWPADLLAFLAEEGGAAPRTLWKVQPLLSAVRQSLIPGSALCVRFCLITLCFLTEVTLWAAKWHFIQRTGKGFLGNCALPWAQTQQHALFVLLK